MSKQNKANKNNYVQAGRLTPDDMARERMNQGQTTGRAKSKENVIGKTQRPASAPESTPSRSGREEEE
jgi:hypothetical protein